MATSQGEVGVWSPEWTAEDWKRAAEATKVHVMNLRLALSDAEEQLEFMQKGYTRQYHREYRRDHKDEARKSNRKYARRNK